MKLSPCSPFFGRKRLSAKRPMFILPALFFVFFAQTFSGCGSFAPVTNVPSPAPDPGVYAEDALNRMDALYSQPETGEIYADTGTAVIPTMGIVRPTGESLSAGEQYILDMIKSSMNNNFINFAKGRISVVNIIDDEALNNEITRSLSGSNDELSLTARRAARALLTGEIIKIPGSGPPRYTLNFRVTNTETRVSIASYNRIHSDIELIEGIAVNRATEDILRQLNIRLSDAGKQALYGLSNSNEADIALAKGLNAAESGQSLQAMNYLFSAASFDTTASRAADTLSLVQTRNERELEGAGEIVSNFFESRTLWQNRINEYNTFYEDHPPFELYYTKLSPTNMRVSREGDQLYDLQFLIGLRWNQNQVAVMEQVLNEYILDGLDKIKKETPDYYANYNLENLPEETELFSGRDSLSFKLEIRVENENGGVIASGPVTLSGSLYWHEGRIYADCIQQNTVSFYDIAYVREQLTPNLYIRIVSINDVDIETAGENGFMRVSQTQSSDLPREQGSVVPRELQNQIAREDREKEADLARQKREEEAAEARRVRAELAARRRAAVQSLLGLSLYGGAALDPAAGLLGLAYEYVGKSILVDLGIVHDFKLGDDVDVDKTLSNIGITFGLSYAYRPGNKWFVSLGLGGNILTVYETKITTSATTSAAVKSEIYNETIFVPYIKAQYDYSLGGDILPAILHLRLGYQCGLFNADRFREWYNIPGREAGVGNYMLQHSFFVGIVAGIAGIL